MTQAQPGILAPIPAHARYLEFVLRADQLPRRARKVLSALKIDRGLVVGLGARLRRGLETFPANSSLAKSSDGPHIPSTQADLWCWLRGEARGDIHLAGEALIKRLAGAFRLVRSVDGFKHGRGLDLTGYEDGTENPKGRKAASAAFDRGGASFVAVQQWRHDFDAFARLTPKARDLIIGRQLKDNVEIATAPASAHVKRTAQESFEPEAFMLRRSMPWTGPRGAGLMFVAFGKSFDAFAAQLRRMIGAEDGIVDGLFRFSRPLTGGYYWCPPIVRGRLLIEF